MPLSTPNPFGTQTSTPSVMSGQLNNPNMGASVSGFLGLGQYKIGGGNAINTPPNIPPPPVKPTSTGGISFNPKLAAGYKPPPTGNTTAASGQLSGNNSSGDTGLGQYVTNANATSGGGSLTTNANGGVSGYTPPAGYNIDTSNVNSSSIGAGTTLNDVAQKYGSLQDYVNAVSAAQGYSPAYIQALQAQYGTQAQSALLGANLATGAGFQGRTEDQAQTLTGQQQALNTQQQTQANIALNTQQLARTGQISAAQTQLQSSPAAVAQTNALNQYNALSQQYPGVVPPINPNGDILSQLQSAQQAIAASPQFQAGFQNTYTTPGGGTGIYSKLDVSSGALQSDGQGGYQLVSGAAASLGTANAGLVNTNLGQMSGINAALNSTSKTLQTTEQFMGLYGINQTGVSILSQIQQAIQKNLAPAGALAGWNSDLDALRSDYAQYLTARNGSIAGTNDTAASVIPDTISPSQLRTVVGQMTQDGQNTADALGAQVNQALQGLATNSVQSTSGAGSNVGSSWASI